MAMGQLRGGVVDTHALPPQVHWGRPAKEALPDALKKLDCKRAFLMVSGSLRKGTPAVDDVAAALGTACVGVWDGMPAHTPREAVVEAAGKAREAEADVIVTIGGGSITDGAKAVRIALAEDVRDVASLDGFRYKPDDGGNPVHSTPLIPQVTIPTTLSAGEFAWFAGVTDAAKSAESGLAPKETYLYPAALPSAIILDPAMALHTPERLFLSTGLRSVDHCVEALCSPQGNPYSNSTLQAALKLLVRGLRNAKADPQSVAARMDCQIAIWQTVQGCQSGPKMGASHAIGHVIGPAYGVPHGETSCVALPAVLAWNAQDPEVARRQQLVCDVFCELAREQEGEAAFKEATSRSASEHVGGLVRELGLPCSLAEVGIPREKLEDCARRTMKDLLVATNPRPLAGWEDALEILEIAAE